MQDNRQQREQDKFVETDAGLTAVRTLGLGGFLGGIEYDYVDVDYTDGNITLVTYKTGGSGGTTVATLTITYNSSNCIETITKT